MLFKTNQDAIDEFLYSARAERLDSMSTNSLAMAEKMLKNETFIRYFNALKRHNDKMLRIGADNSNDLVIHEIINKWCLLTGLLNSAVSKNQHILDARSKSYDEMENQERDDAKKSGRKLKHGRKRV